MSIPYIGQIVLYHPPLATDYTIEPDCPAIVQALHEDGTVSLCVFGPFDVFMPNVATEGDGPSQWSAQRHDQP